MAISVASIHARRFDPAKLQKLNLFSTPNFFLDVYCLEPGQAQTPHAHAGADKVYVLLEGRAVVRVGGDERALEPGEAALCPSGESHAIENRGPERAAVLVLMAPRP
jgi:mannose-6-phosphate isomerase-like protein (cupin superfamily)